MPYAAAMIVTATCPNCNSTFHLDRDEDGFTEIEHVKCAAVNCPVQLCPECPKASCAGCGQKFCREHMIEEKLNLRCTCLRDSMGEVHERHLCFEHNPRIRPRNPLWCASCAEEQELMDLPEEVQIPRLEPVSVTVMHPNIPEWQQGGVA